MRGKDALADLEPIPQTWRLPHTDADQASLQRLCQFLEDTDQLKPILVPTRTQRLLTLLLFIPKRGAKPDIRSQDFRYLWCQMHFPGPKSCLMLPSLWEPETRCLLLVPRRDRKDLALFADQAAERPAQPQAVKLMPLYQGDYRRTFHFDFRH